MINYYVTINLRGSVTRTINLLGSQYSISEFGELTIYNSDSDKIWTFAREFWVAITTEDSRIEEEINPKINFKSLQNLEN